MQPKVYSYIRFSTPEQKLGNSLARQIDNARAYAKARNLVFDESLVMKDEGLSGYKGTNVTKGELGKFIQEIENGNVAKGSILLLDAADRLSRLPMVNAIALMTRIVSAGITIVTTGDGMEYSNETFANNQMAFISYVLKAQLATNQSAEKSRLLKKAWATKRDNLGTPNSKILTSRAPAWVTYDKKAEKFFPIKERVAVLQEIFQLSANGVGQTLIARQFNEKGVPVFGRGNGWHSSYIQKILGNRSAIGEMQPHKMIDGKRTPEGEAIKDYFPQAISPKLFNQVNLKRRAEATFRGKRPESARNLFTRIAISGYSGSSVIYLNKGKGRKGGAYLVSDKARRGLGEKYASWSYPKFEDSFLTFVTELNFAQVFQENTTNTELESLKVRVANLQLERERLTATVERIMDSLEQGGQDSARWMQRLKQREAELKSVEADEKDTSNKAEALESVSKNFVANGKTLQKLFQERDNPEIRFRLRAAIQEQIKKVEVFFYGLDADSEWFRDRVRAAGDYNALLEQFQRTPSALFQTHLRAVSPGSVADLAHRFYDNKEDREKFAAEFKEFDDKEKAPVSITDRAEKFCKGKVAQAKFVAECISKDFSGQYQNPFFVVTFKNGAMRYVEPKPDNAKEFSRVAQWGGELWSMYSLTAAA